MSFEGFFVNRKRSIWRKLAFCWKPRFAFPATLSETRQDKIREKKLLAPTYFDFSTNFSQKNGLELIHESLIPWCNTLKRLLDWKTSYFVPLCWILDGQELRKVHFIKLCCHFWISEHSKLSGKFFASRPVSHWEFSSPNPVFCRNHFFCVQA